MVEIEIDEQKVRVPEGATIIEAADQVGIYIPRFCYHRKLSIAANCRMCLVEVDQSRKPLPACATSVTDGMVVRTRSAMALKAQRDVMEFLLINHPLDCPICDQGGECELQDLSMGYGRANSRYEQMKRSVPSEDIGALVETWMTRCIHCTRCVRFGEEIAGVREMGMMYRGEQAEIGTYVQHFLTSELSGNIIDLCPVGALTNKPARYQGRSWEYHESAAISPHDAVGSHLFVHTRGRIIDPQRDVMRVVPRECDSINETWIADRDRYSVHGLYHESRVYKPLRKYNGEWQEIDWPRALDEIADRVRTLISQKGSEEIAGLASSSSTVEELYLLQKLLRGLGSNNIDHRLREHDFSDQQQLPVSPQLPIDITHLEDLRTVMLIGANIRCEQPMFSHRINKAVNDGANVLAINPIDCRFIFPVKQKLIVNPAQLPLALARVARALADLTGETIVALESITPCATSKEMAKQLCEDENAAIFLGELAQNHPQASVIRALTHKIAGLCGAKVCVLTAGANGAGAWLAGAVPHRGVAGQPLVNPGKNAKQLLTTDPVRAYFLLNTEPEFDSGYAYHAEKNLELAGLVVCMTPFASEAMKNYADFILPIAPFTETAGTYVNAAGHWQSFSPASVPHGEARPAWKVLRVLANFLELEGFDYRSAQEVRREIKGKTEATSAQIEVCETSLEPLVTKETALTRLAPWPMYRIDNLVRRSEPLQECEHEPIHKGAAVNSKTASALGIAPGIQVTAVQGDSRVSLPLLIDERLPENTVLLPSGLAETAGFGDASGKIELMREQ